MDPEDRHLRGNSFLCTGNSFSPVPFMGRLRAYRFHSLTFDTVITPVACFVAGHRAIFKNDLNNVDVVFRKLLRIVVGPPAATDWSRPWHEILHDRNARVAQFVQQYSVKCWSVRCVEMHWNLAQYAANHLRTVGCPAF